MRHVAVPLLVLAACSEQQAADPSQPTAADAPPRAVDVTRHA